MCLPWPHICGVFDHSWIPRTTPDLIAVRVLDNDDDDDDVYLNKFPRKVLQNLFST